MHPARTRIPSCIMPSLPLLLRANGRMYYPMLWNPGGRPRKWVDRVRLSAWRRGLKPRCGSRPARKRKPWSQEDIFIIKRLRIFTRQPQMLPYRKNILQNARVCPGFHFPWLGELLVREKSVIIPLVSEEVTHVHVAQGVMIQSARYSATPQFIHCKMLFLS
jgi:hypothetical protein